MEVKYEPNNIYRDYIMRIDHINAQHNAPEYANMEVEYEDYQNKLIFIRSKEKPLYDDVLLEVQERISFDIEREVEFDSLEVEYEIIGVLNNGSESRT